MPYFYPLFTPLIAAFLAALPSPNSKKKNYQLSWWIIFSGFLGSLILLWELIQNPEPIKLTLLSTNLEILPAFTLAIDRLAAVMMVVISGFGTLLYHYSRRYLQQDAGQNRFQALLAALVSCLLFMVTTNDFLTLFIFWQLLTWIFCLLFHNYAHKQTTESSFKTFLILRFGDFAFLSAILLSYRLYGSFQLSEVFQAAALDQTSFNILGSGLEISATTTITLLLFIAMMAKSAQFPFHTWLEESLYSPTSVSAILHAGLINAGGFLFHRLAPLFALSSTTLHVALIIGLITMLVGKCIMLVQPNIKKTLVYSTIGQMGYMIMECGVGAFSLAVFHLIAHGLFKAYLFLNSGSFITDARLEPKHPPIASKDSSVSINRWLFAFSVSFIAPLAIMIWVHQVLGISFAEHQGLFILFLFSWITSSQAMLTLFRLQKTIFTKLAVLIAIAAIAIAYFFAAESFTQFLIPDHHLVEAYFKAAALPEAMFIVLATLLILAIVAVWLFAFHRQEKDSRKVWFKSLKLNLYMFFVNGLYLDLLCTKPYATLKKFLNAEHRIPLALSYLAIAQLSIPALHYIGTGELNKPYLISIALIYAGLFFAWNSLRSRYGALNLEQSSGLFHTMPRFSLLTAILFMAAIGIAPLGLFSASLGILAKASIWIAISMIIVLFFISIYLFNFMQRLLFGATRTDLEYSDLNLLETIVLTTIVLASISPEYIMELIA